METLVETALYNALLANNDVTAQTSEVYPVFAPSTAGEDYVLLMLNAGGKTNDANDDNVDLRYAVIGVSPNVSKALALADAIRETFNEASLTLADGWSAYRTQILTPIRQVEHVDRVPYFRYGHIVRIRANKVY
jgi:hypothetical protein